MSRLSKVVGFKVNRHNSVVFPCIGSKHLKTQIKHTTYNSIFFFWIGLGWNSGLHTHKAGDLLLEQNCLHYSRSAKTI
jgi:hypothetical protein